MSWLLSKLGIPGLDVFPPLGPLVAVLSYTHMGPGGEMIMQRAASHEEGATVLKTSFCLDLDGLLLQVG